jgi:two-component system, NarL family, sensor histidine kinase DesK
MVPALRSSSAPAAADDPQRSERAAAERVLAGRNAPRWRLYGAFWLVFLADAVVQVITRDQPVLLKVLGLVGIATFCVAYILVPPYLLQGRLPDRYRPVYVVAMFGLATALLPLTGQAGLSMYVYVAVVSITLLDTRPALAVVAGLLVLAPALQLLVPSWPNTFWIALPIATASAAVFGIVGLIQRNIDLADAHEQLKEMAVEQERARFARDLHDLLGHSLSVITVKSELARRVMASDPDRAAAEVADIERLSREALADVRATVAGYRGVTLAAEISSARSALAAAGVHADLPGAVDDVPGDRRELFGWVLREGVTNVVRHSDASRVRVSVSAHSVEIVDDGTVAATSADGSGLAGLRERLADVGGRLDAGPVDGGGFRLYAEVPA